MLVDVCGFFVWCLSIQKKIVDCLRQMRSTGCTPTRTSNDIKDEQNGYTFEVHQA